MLGDVAGRVGLDEEIEVARSLVGGDGSVRADNFIWLACYGRRKGDVLSYREPEDVCGSRKCEAVAGGCQPTAD